MDVRLASTFLFVPGSRPDRFSKAAASGADAVIIDLEDAVGPEDKHDARTAAAEFVDASPAVVRVNSVESPWLEADLAALRHRRYIKGVMVPKGSSPEELAAVAHALGSVSLLVLVESALGVMHAAELARVPGVTRLAFGNLDFAADTGICPSQPDEPELLYACSQLVVASRAAGLEGPIAGVTQNVTDPTFVARDAERQRRLGFTGKLLIHPSQVPGTKPVFQAQEQDLDWAKRILRAAGSSRDAVVLVDGEMVDKPVILRAERILARIDAREAATGNP
ncbi:HpcH/HpaI aldolase/citrate lyase family protein [Arthrobacter sp. NPDC057013]|uniref:HpcH/HpaI aldolase/citrate lyase family protein n=1 Tax=Arthrobacter sp. NPDC057013 TaxID=3345999 RepID=UPI00362BFADA